MKKLMLLSAAGLMAMASCRTYCPAYSKTEAPKANTATAKAEQPKQVRG
jgi:hypothetical protein